MRPVENLLSRLSNVAARGDRWIASCPAHDDETPSLSVAEGHDGRVLVKCHAGCDLDAITAKVGLAVSDLFDAAGHSRRAEELPRRRDTSFESFEQVVAHVRGGVRRGTRAPYELVAQYDYRATDGGEVRVLRFEAEGKSKSIRQVSLRNGRWQATRGTAKTLPYRVDDLGAAPMVLLVEGEKCVEAVRAIGLAATTSAGGASAARKTDWIALAGRTIVAFPDNDAPGHSYVRDVAGALGKLALPTVELPVGPSQDIADYVVQRQRDGLQPDAIRGELLAFADEQLSASTEPALPIVPNRVPFPIELLPRVAREFVQRTAAIMCTDPSTLALGALVAMSAAIGRAVKLRVTDEWYETCALWVAIVAPSGRGKSPAIRAAIRHIFDLDAAAKRRHDAALRAYQDQEERRRTASERQNSDTTTLPRPVREKLVVTDLTIEALVLLLTENPRGLLFAPDELDSFFGSLDRYRSGGGSDRPQWLAVHSGGPIRYERKTSGALQVEHSFVSMIGGIQPPVLGRTFRGEGVSSGLAARFLLYQPSPVPRVLRRHLDTASARANFDALLDRLYSIPVRADQDDPSQTLDLSDEAGDLFERFVSAWDRRFSPEADEELRAAAAKLEAYALRISLILHVADQAAASADAGKPLDVRNLPPVSRRAVRAAIEITRWAIGSANRSYTELRRKVDMTKLEARVRTLCEHPGGVTVREWQRVRFKITAEQARTELDELVTAGLAETARQPSSPRGGRPSVVYRVLPTAAVATTGGPGSPTDSENWLDELGSVDVDDVGDAAASDAASGSAG